MKFLRGLILMLLTVWVCSYLGQFITNESWLMQPFAFTYAALFVLGFFWMLVDIFQGMETKTAHPEVTDKKG